jgi:outer membrane protein TolC
VYESTYHSALATRPDLRKLAHQVNAVEALKDLEWSGHLPSLSLFGRVQAQDQQNDFTFSRYTWPVSSMVGLQLSIPLFNGFRTDSRVQQAEITRLQAETQLYHLREVAGTEIQVALGNLAEAERRLASSASTVQAAERSYQKTRSSWQQGRCKQIEVSDANLMLNQAKLDRLQAIADCLVAQIEFEKAAGTIVQ